MLNSENCKESIKNYLKSLDENDIDILKETERKLNNHVCIKQYMLDMSGEETQEEKDLFKAYFGIIKLLNRFFWHKEIEALDNIYDFLNRNIEEIAKGR